jgi:hypothetical protein
MAVRLSVVEDPGSVQVMVETWSGQPLLLPDEHYRLQLWPAGRRR